MGRRSCPPEFRRKVLDLLEVGRTATELAHDLGISRQTIYTWRRQDRIGRGLEPDLTSGEKAEPAAARRRIAELETKLQATRRAIEPIREAAPQRFGVEPICRVLGFAPATYDAARSGPPSARERVRRTSRADRSADHAASLLSIRPPRRPRRPCVPGRPSRRGPRRHLHRRPCRSPGGAEPGGGAVRQTAVLLGRVGSGRAAPSRRDAVAPGAGAGPGRVRGRRGMVGGPGGAGGGHGGRGERPPRLRPDRPQALMPSRSRDRGRSHGLTP
ncbi:transposase [Nonomuraea sp. FMUSA5-5]|uniref:Transposase n=1 Tax=Nonomuraea composti TaxID=2720023 RepID=A0ABX1BJI8_9ACTN|nr:transposase [Nonomuraea sp. FMUSA5-5]